MAPHLQSSGDDTTQAPAFWANGNIAQPKVLIVDDEPDIVEEVVEQLEDQGISCVSALNPKSAIELVNMDAEIGVVVTDIRMPGMDGLEMARQMKAVAGNQRDLFIIVVTGHAGMKEAVEALQLGAEDFLTKPISPDHLLHSVRRASELLQLRQHERAFQKELAHQVDLKTSDLNIANEKLMAANRIKDQFLSLMGHELRTPLNAINGFAELLKVKLAALGDPALDEYLDYILQSGERLSDSIENILELSTALAGNRIAHVELQTLEDLFDNVMGQTQTLAANKGIHFELPPLPQDQLVEIDSMMMVKTLTCLVDNAIKFSPAGSTVTLAAVKTTESFTLRVQDEGPGMTADEIELARQPFSQVSNGLDRTAEGTGVGLSLAMLLSELQGGQLTIDSTPGKGTKVNITLPAR